MKKFWLAALAVAAALAISPAAKADGFTFIGSTATGFTGYFLFTGTGSTPGYLTISTNLGLISPSNPASTYYTPGTYNLLSASGSDATILQLIFSNGTVRYEILDIFGSWQIEELVGLTGTNVVPGSDETFTATAGTPEPSSLLLLGTGLLLLSGSLLWKARTRRSGLRTIASSTPLGA
jgi:hypothetical protein